jgi:hypothetical protein
MGRPIITRRAIKGEVTAMSRWSCYSPATWRWSSFTSSSRRTAEPVPFEFPEKLQPDCAPVAWLLGTWRGNGHGDYPTIDQLGQECIFTHDGRPFFTT